MTNKTEAKMPTHRVYAVTKSKNGRGFWTEIGAAWANADGKGFNLKLNFLPLGDAEIVVREPRTDEDDDQGGAA